MSQSPPQVCRKTVKIQNKLGLHARPAMAFVDLAGRYKSTLTIRKQGQTVDGKSIMQMMMLAATQGTELEIEASGPDAEKMVADLEDLVNRRFDEDG